LVNREDTIHIKIKLDIDENDKQLITDVSENLAKTDEQKVTKQSSQGKTAEDEQLQREIDQIEKDIKNLKKDQKKKKDQTLEEKKKELEAKKDRLLLKQFKAGPIGIINDFTKEQVNNLRTFVSNPAEFLIAGITGKLGKFGKAAMKGGLIAVIGLLVYETVMFVIDQLMQPGRALDRRFKRIAQLETMNFYERQLQEDIRHGYQEIRVTTMPGLRGGASQVNGNFFEFSSGPVGIIQSSPYRNSQEIYRSETATGSATDAQGNPRRRTVSGRFG